MKTSPNQSQTGLAQSCCSQLLCSQGGGWVCEVSGARMHLFWLSVALMSAARVEAESVRCLGLACIYSGWASPLCLQPGWRLSLWGVWGSQAFILAERRPYVCSQGGGWVCEVSGARMHLFWLSVALMSAARVEAESVRCLGLAGIYSGRASPLCLQPGWRLSLWGVWGSQAFILAERRPYVCSQGGGWVCEVSGARMHLFWLSVTLIVNPCSSHGTTQTQTLPL